MSDRFNKEPSMHEVAEGAKAQIEEMRKETGYNQGSIGDDTLHIFFANAWPSFESQCN
jgi:hypothetical protein